MVSPNADITQEDFSLLETYNFNWTAISPFAFVHKNSPEIKYNLEWQWKSETPEGIALAIKNAKNAGVKVMLKPQLWGHDLFTGHINFSNDSLWEIFEQDYKEYLQIMAKIADSCDVEVLCIGTELASFVQNRPAFWKELIVQIKSEYTGQITYAENWDSYEKVPFWNELDYIGVDAYFPLSVKKEPTLKDLKEGWAQWKSNLSELSQEFNKPILFTEWGYRSIDYNAKEPWVHGNKAEVNLANQSRSYIAYFNEIYQEKWFAGGFLWKWFPSAYGQIQEKDGYTPQGKPSLDLFRRK